MTDHFTAAYNALCAMRDRDRDAQLALDELSIKKTEMERITTLLVGAGYRTLADIDHAMASLIELRDTAERQQEALRIAGYEGPDALDNLLADAKDWRGVIRLLGRDPGTERETGRAREDIEQMLAEQDAKPDPKVADVMRQMEPKGAPFDEAATVGPRARHTDGAWRTHDIGTSARGARIAYDDGRCWEHVEGRWVACHAIVADALRKAWVEAAPCWKPTPPIDPHSPTVFTGTGNTLPMSGCEVPRTTRIATPYPKLHRIPGGWSNVEHDALKAPDKGDRIAADLGGLCSEFDGREWRDMPQIHDESSRKAWVMGAVNTPYPDNK